MKSRRSIEAAGEPFATRIVVQVFLVVRLRLRNDLGMHDVEEPLVPRVPDQDKAVLVERVGEVRAQLVVERRGSFVERHAVLLQVDFCPPRSPPAAPILTGPVWAQSGVSEIYRTPTNARPA